MYLKIVPIVKAKNSDFFIKNAGVGLAQYENLENHHKAIEGY